MSFIMVTMAIVLPLTLREDSEYIVAGPPNIQNNSTLFFEDGSTNEALRAQLLALASNIEFRPADVGGIVHYGSTARHITNANGSLPEVHLFESAGAFVGNPTTPSDFATNIRAQSWRLMYITHPVGGDPVFTFWMTDVYRTTPFHSNSNAYATSTVRTNINNDFNVVFSQFPQLAANNHIVTPNQLPNSWQQNQPLTLPLTSLNASGTNSLRGEVGDDRVWIPSSFELEDGYYGGEPANLWDVVPSDRALGPRGFPAWLRTADSRTSWNMISGNGYAARFLPEDFNFPGRIYVGFESIFHQSVGARFAIHLRLLGMCIGSPIVFWSNRPEAGVPVFVLGVIAPRGTRRVPQPAPIPPIRVGSYAADWYMFSHWSIYGTTEPFTDWDDFPIPDDGLVFIGNWQPYQHRWSGVLR